MNIKLESHKIDPINRLETAVAKYDQSCARTRQDVLEMLQQVHLCLEKFPPEQAQTGAAIALLANALWRTLSIPHSVPVDLQTDSSDQAMSVE